MAEERNVGLARATEAEEPETDATKQELQRRMEEARESISQTVSEIKETVVTQYQQVRENISDSLDWREQYRRPPVEFSVGAMGVGLVLGYAIGGAFVGGRGDDDYLDEEDVDDYEYEADAAQSGILPSSPRTTYAPPSPAPFRRASSPPAPQMLAGQAASRASEIVGPEPSASYDSSASEESEPSGPGLMERFKETRAYDRLQQELYTLGDRAVDELSKTAQTVVLPAILGKLKDLIGIDLSAQREVAKRSQLEHQAAKASAGTAAAAEEQPVRRRTRRTSNA